ncbi:hypothetical protein PO909_021042 [Leuciscus waleckii]
MVLLLQWNARSLMANGQEFKKYIDDLPNKPDIICVQETWLRPNLEFRLDGYASVRCDRGDGVGGGCATFIGNDISFREVSVGGKEQEYVSVAIWTNEGECVIINYYNPCRKLELGQITQIVGLDGNKVVVCGDFNAHSTLWGGVRTDANGEVIEELLEERNMVCLNDGRGTRIDVHTGNISVLDLTLVSRNLAGICEWELSEESSVGSDHFPVWCSVLLEINKDQRGLVGKWIFSSAKWETFKYMCEIEMDKIDLNEEIEEIDKNIRTTILQVAKETISKSKGKMKRKAVPWWTEECGKIVKERNKALRLLRKNHNFHNLIKYKETQAKVRKIIRKAKKQSWQTFCDKIGRATPVGDVWNMIKSMRGIRREWKYPILKMGEETAVSDQEKAEMIAKAFTLIHSSDNLTEEGKRGRTMTRLAYGNYLERREDSNSVMDAQITMEEMRRAIKKSGLTSPGKDDICYVMIEHLGVLASTKLLGFYNKVWDLGKLPTGWKEAIIIPIRKPGKDLSSPMNYRPIALTSHVGKIMERIITDRLSFYMESRGILSPHQSGFRRGRGTMDPVMCLETEIRKAQVNKESVMAVFFDVEKAYDMVWKEGVMIKLKMIGIAGRTYNWIKGFLDERSILVRIGTAVSRRYMVENGTPQGSVISPILFSIMINDVFSQVQGDIGQSLFADDGALWKRGRNINHIKGKIQEAINVVERWSIAWGFKFAIGKTKTIFFTRKRGVEAQVKMYGQDIVKSSQVKFLGMWFDDKLTWNEHIRRINTKCKKIINVMRCLTGSEWGASRAASKNVYIALIRSVLDYGCIAYGSAAKTSLKKLDVVQAQALRLCCGAVKTTPVAALQVEMGEMPLHIRRKQLMMHYWINLQGHSGDRHPTTKILLPCWESERAKRGCFAWRCEEIAGDMTLNQGGYIPTVPLSVTPPWLFPPVSVDLYFLEKMQGQKGFGNIAELVEDRIQKLYQTYVQIYTDGSKDPNTGKAGFGFSIPTLHVSGKRRTSDHLSVYTVEMLAIVIALQKVEELQIKKVIL